MTLADDIYEKNGASWELFMWDSVNYVDPNRVHGKVGRFTDYKADIFGEAASRFVYFKFFHTKYKFN